jgi:hypothetical protein
MNVRKLGTSMAVFGAIAAVTGLVVNGVQLERDPSLLERRGVLDVSCPSCAVFFAGIALVLLGLLLHVAGPSLYEPRRRRVAAERRLAQVGVPAIVVALLAGGAAAAANSPLAEPTRTATPDTSLIATTGTTGATAATAGGHQHGVVIDESQPHSHDANGNSIPLASGNGAATHQHGNVIAGSATGDSPCEKAAPVAASPGETGTGEGGSQGSAEGEHGERGLVVQQPLTQAERQQLELQMRAARSVIDKYPTVATAQAAGYHMSTVYVPCIGAHYTNVGLVAKFDPGAPSELLYDGTTPDAKIVGLSYLVFHPGGPPEGFAGTNDHWHQHNANGGLCLNKTGTVVGGEDVSAKECAKRGGAKRVLKDIWMVHAWVAPGWECSWGTFAGECPELGGTTGKTAFD